MIVGGYTLNLYCDDPQHASRHPNKIVSVDAQFVGEGAGDCRNQARRRGWKFDLHKWTATCPACVKANRAEEAQP